MADDLGRKGFQVVHHWILLGLMPDSASSPSCKDAQQLCMLRWVNNHKLPRYNGSITTHAGNDSPAYICIA